jgi:iron complex outermembrane receptor protein
VPYGNGVLGKTRGFEVAPDWKPSRRLQLKASYSYLDLDLRNAPGNTDTAAVARYEGSSPRHQVTVQAQLTLPKGLEVDPTLRHVSALPARSVAAYTTLDLRVGFRFAHAFELSLVGQNLLQPRHAEFGHDPPPTVEMKRAAFARLVWNP